MSIFDYIEIKYDKGFVTESLIFVQENNILDFDLKKAKILNTISNIKNLRNEENTEKYDLVITRIFEKLSLLCKRDKKVNELKWQIFYMMKKILVKNINNYQKLCRNSVLGANYNTDEEMESECFLVFENCVYKFVSDSGKNDFYFYFNKSLSRSLYKIFLKNIKNTESVSNASSLSEYSEENDVLEKYLDHSTNNLSIKFTLTNFKFDDNCLKVIDSKLRGEKMSEFIRSSSDMDQKVYDKSLKKVKKELNLERDFDLQLKRLEKYSNLESRKDEDEEVIDEMDFFDYYTKKITNQYDGEL